MSSDVLNEVVIRVLFVSEREAKIARNVLVVDREVLSDLITKEISFENNLLRIELKSNSLKRLRVCVNSLCHFLDSIIETIALFDDQS